MEEQTRDAWQRNIAVRYLSEAAIYDRVHPALTNKEERRRLERLLAVAVRSIPQDAPSTGLDIGAGTGFVTERLHAWGFRVIATDISAAMLGRLRRRFVTAVRAGHVHCVLEDAETFLLTHPNRYAVITIRAAIHHMPDPATLLRLCGERLIPGGALLLLHEPVATTHPWWVHALLSLDWFLAWAFLLSFDDLRLYRSIGIDPQYRDAHQSPAIIEEAGVRSIARAVGLTVVASERASSAHTRMIRWLLRWTGQKTTWNLVLRRPLSTSSETADFSQ
jgi:SAM-dependent methyltransferase